MTIEGVSLAKELYPEVKFKLFGDRKSESLIKKFNLKQSVEFIHTSEFIKSSDQPVNALRKLKKSSIRLATNDVKNKKFAMVLFLAGNTGALNWQYQNSC